MSFKIRELEAALRANGLTDVSKASSQGNSEDSNIFDQYIQPTQSALEASQSFSQESESDLDDLTKTAPGRERHVQYLANSVTCN